VELHPYIENIHQQVAAAAEAGGEESRMLAQRLLAPLDSAIHLTLLEALGAAAEEITCDLAPGQVELRLRGRDPEFVVTLPPADPADPADEPPAGPGGERGPARTATASQTTGALPLDSDDGGMSRINLRLPDHLKARVERAADAEGLSINAWLVRAATNALERNPAAPPPGPRPASGSRRYTGWAR
jgi:hypothetical protein